VLKGSDKTSSLAVSLSLAVDLIEGHINDVAANKVGGGLVWIATLSHFPELLTELELLGFRHNVDPTKGQLDALWTQTCRASESLALGIPSPIARDSPDDAGGSNVSSLAIFVFFCHCPITTKLRLMSVLQSLDTIVLHPLSSSH
jgi:hypothetical protein